MTTFKDLRLTWTDCDEAEDYVVPNVLSPRDLVFRPDIMDETVKKLITLAIKQQINRNLLFLVQDFNIQGTQLISCGMDHSLKMWTTDTERINDAIKDSYVYNPSKSNK